MPTKKKICNWKDYNEALIKRGSLIFSFDENYLKKLYHTDKQNPGGVRKYSAKMYEYLLTVKVLLRFSWRSTIGFVGGLIKKVCKGNVLLPNFAHAAREANKLDLKIRSYSKKEVAGGMEIALDSTGVKVYARSGYHQSKFGKDNLFQKKDQWKKLHFAVDLTEQQILSMVYTESNVNDCVVVDKLLNAEIKRKASKIIADGAYDTEKIYQLTHGSHIEVLIPPSINSKAQHELKHKEAYKEYLKQRDAIIDQARKAKDFKTGLKQWKIKSGYHKRSLIECCMFRFKMIFGFQLHQKHEKGRKNETIAKINVLNKMTLYGMPRYKNWI